MPKKVEVRLSSRSIVKESTYGFLHVDPVPSPKELGEFYESRYYDLIRKGGRAPDLRRLLEGGASGIQERRWLCEGLYTDVIAVLMKYGPGKRLLEVGCGTGEFLAFAGENGFDAVGIEPSAEAAQLAADRKLRAHALTLEQFVEARRREDDVGGFDAVVMLHVLEHVPDPIGTVQQCKMLLNQGGMLCVQLPNDFTSIQRAAEKRINKREWWVAVPDHINYFDFQSLSRVLEGCGFEVVYQQGDFPMEFFLLMGEDYVGNPEIGKQCHKRRVQFDLALPPALRRTIYNALAKVGVGRSCLMFARMRSL